MKKLKYRYLLILILPIIISCTTFGEQDNSAGIIPEIVSAETTAPAVKTASKSLSSESSDISKLKGYKEVSALIKGYPGTVISGMKSEGNDISIPCKMGKKFYYAEGRLLPEEKKDAADKYRSYGFYNYPEKLPLP